MVDDVRSTRPVGPELASLQEGHYSLDIARELEYWLRGYSARSVTAGSMRPARHAGTIIATVPNATRRMVTLVTTLASNGRVSYSSP